MNQAQLRYREKVKREALSAYGECCAICGEKRFELLRIPRNLGNENYFRELERSGDDEPMPGWNLYVWLTVRDWPKNFGFETRCEAHDIAQARNARGRFAAREIVTSAKASR
jgi:hypothetical protein